MRRAEIERLLPSVIRRAATPDGPLGVLLEVMEALHAPDEAVLDDLDRYFAPDRAPERLVLHLAGWVGLDWLITGSEATSVRGDGPLRELIANAAALARERGTSDGLRRFLHLATGGRDFDVVPALDEHGRERPFAITVLAPADLEPQRPLLEAILRHEKPVYVHCELRFGSEGPRHVVGAPPSARGTAGAGSAHGGAPASSGRGEAR